MLDDPARCQYALLVIRRHQLLVLDTKHSQHSKKVSDWSFMHLLAIQGRQGMALRNSRRLHGSHGGSASHGLADMAVDDVPGPAIHREPSAGSTMSDDGPPGL